MSARKLILHMSVSPDGFVARRDDAIDFNVPPGGDARRRCPRSTGATPGSPELKAEGGKDTVVFGGGTLCNSLVRERLVDEYRLTVHPVALGDGIPLMHGLPEPQRLRMIGSTVYADGWISHVSVPAV